MMTAQLELGSRVAQSGPPQTTDEAVALGVWHRHSAQVEQQVAKAAAAAARVERRARRERSAQWVPTTEFEKAAALLGSRKTPHRDEAVELIGTAGIRAALGIREMRNDAFDHVAHVVESAKRARAIEVEHARMIREEGTLKANAWRAAQSLVTTRTPTAEETELRQANQTVEAGLLRIVAAIHASIQNDGAFHDAPLRDPESDDGTGRYVGPRPTLGAEYRRRVTLAHNRVVQGMAETTRFNPNSAVNSSRLQAAQPVALSMLLGLYHVPVAMVEAWLGDADVIERYGLADLWSE
jgi:hypothetical protein